MIFITDDENPETLSHHDTWLWWWIVLQSWWWGVSVGVWACMAASPPQTSWKQMTVYSFHFVRLTQQLRSTAEHSSDWLVVVVQFLTCHHTGWCVGCAGGSCLYLLEPLHCTVLLVAFHYTSWWDGRGGTWLAPPSEVFVVGLDHIRRWPSQPVRPVCPADAWSGKDSGLSK